MSMNSTKIEFFAFKGPRSVSLSKYTFARAEVIKHLEVPVSEYFVDSSCKEESRKSRQIPFALLNEL